VPDEKKCYFMTVEIHINQSRTGVLKNFVTHNHPVEWLLAYRITNPGIPMVLLWYSEIPPESYEKAKEALNPKPKTTSTGGN